MPPRRSHAGRGNPGRQHERGRRSIRRVRPVRRATGWQPASEHGAPQPPHPAQRRRTGDHRHAPHLAVDGPERRRRTPRPQLPCSTAQHRRREKLRRWPPQPSRSHPSPARQRSSLATPRIGGTVCPGRLVGRCDPAPRSRSQRPLRRHTPEPGPRRPQRCRPPPRRPSLGRRRRRRGLAPQGTEPGSSPCEPGSVGRQPGRRAAPSQRSPGRCRLQHLPQRAVGHPASVRPGQIGFVLAGLPVPSTPSRWSAGAGQPRQNRQKRAGHWLPQLA